MHRKLLGKGSRPKIIKSEKIFEINITLKRNKNTVCHRDGSDQLFPTLLKYVNYEGS